MIAFLRAPMVLAGWVLGVWLLGAACEHLLHREDLVVPTLVAALICLIPAELTLVWALCTLPRDPAGRLQLFVFGSLVRMGLTAAAGMATYSRIESCATPPFLVALLGFYMLALALETRLLAARYERIRER